MIDKLKRYKLPFGSACSCPTRFFSLQNRSGYFSRPSQPGDPRDACCELVSLGGSPRRRWETTGVSKTGREPCTKWNCRGSSCVAGKPSSQKPGGEAGISAVTLREYWAVSGQGPSAVCILVCNGAPTGDGNWLTSRPVLRREGGDGRTTRHIPCRPGPVTAGDPPGCARLLRICLVGHCSDNE